MIRSVYSGLMWLAQPFLRARLRRRGIAEPGYLVAMDQRFGRYEPAGPPGKAPLDSASSSPLSAGYVWVHAVSLGETRVAALLISELRKQLPGMRLLLTHGTATGREEGARLLRPGDVQVWQPWDAPGPVNRFLTHFNPRIGLLLETEIWPNLSAICRIRAVPLVLVNARLSAKSLAQALRLNWLARPAYAGLTAVWAQTQEDAARLRRLGAPVRGVFGNLKFDAAPDADQLQRGRALHQVLAQPTVMFASSREGEEASLVQILEEKRPEVHVQYKYLATEKVASNIQWLIVPRHPQRFDAVATLITQAGLSVSRRSGWSGSTPPAAAPQGGSATVWLGDSLGEMALYFGLADLALLGGSFEPLGGQNLIEAAACGCPVILGPHTFNFAEAAELAVAAGAAVRVDTLAQAVDQARVLMADPIRLGQMRDAASRFTADHRGAVSKTVAAVVGLLY